MSIPKRNVGLHKHRLRDNPEEKRFADAWQKQDAAGNTLAHLLSETSWPADVTPRDRLVAATVMQWLGSPVGQHWLGELGYRRTSKEDDRPHA